MAEIRHIKRGPTISTNTEGYFKLAAAIAPSAKTPTPLPLGRVDEVTASTVTPYHLYNYGPNDYNPNTSQPKDADPEFYDLYNPLGLENPEGPHQSRYFLVVSENQLLDCLDPTTNIFQTDSHHSAYNSTYDFSHKGSKTRALRSATTAASKQLVSAEDSRFIISGIVDMVELYQAYLGGGLPISLPSNVRVDKILEIRVKEGYVNRHSPRDTFTITEIALTSDPTT